MSQVLDPSLADKARGALQRHAWREAYDLLSKADGKGTLMPQELELLAQASWCVGRLPLAIEAVDLAIDCAIAIQRRLADQRCAQGYAPTLRIGIHRAEANRAGLAYSGTAVNQAARIGASAASAEVVISAETFAAVRRSFPEVGRRTVELKGISQPVEIVSIGWR